MRCADQHPFPNAGAQYCVVYNLAFSGHVKMEAERINAIAKQLQDVEARAADLRRYL